MLKGKDLCYLRQAIDGSCLRVLRVISFLTKALSSVRGQSKNNQLTKALVTAGCPWSTCSCVYRTVQTWSLPPLRLISACSTFLTIVLGISKRSCAAVSWVGQIYSVTYKVNLHWQKLLFLSWKIIRWRRMGRNKLNIWEEADQNY